MIGGALHIPLVWSSQRFCNLVKKEGVHPAAFKDLFCRPERCESDVLCLSVCMSVCLSVFIRLSGFSSLGECLSVSLSLSVCIGLSLCVSLCVSVCLCLSPCDVCVSVRLSVSRCVLPDSGGSWGRGVRPGWMWGSPSQPLSPRAPCTRCLMSPRGASGATMRWAHCSRLWSFKAQPYLFLVSLLLFVDITIILKPSKSKIWYLKTSAVS